jgi:outer membrane lipoprotein-sorting protein
MSGSLGTPLAIRLFCLLSTVHCLLSTALVGRAAEDAAEPLRKLSEQELDSLLDRLEAKLGRVRSLRANFVQEKHLSIFTDVVKSEGVLLFLRPDSVRFEMTKPYQSVLIAAERSVARYEFLDGHWQKMKSEGVTPVRVVTEQIAMWMAGKFRERKDVYGISATADGMVTITLTPRNEKFRQYVTAIELGLNKEESYFSTVTIREPGGDFTRMLFVNPEHNIDLPKQVFDTAGPAPPPLGPPSSDKRP